MSPRTPRAELALVLVALVWGATFVLVKAALEGVSTLLFLALRFSLAGAVLAVAYRGRMSWALSRGSRPFAGGLAAGICLFGGYLFQTLGLRFTTPSKSAFLTGLSIVLVPLFGASMRRRLPPERVTAGVLTAAAGMALLTLESGDWRASPGDLLTLAGAVFFALHILALGRYVPRDGFEPISVLQVATAAGLSLVSFWWAETPFITWNGAVLLALGVTGLLATAGAFTIQAWAQQRTNPTRTALIFALEPVFAAATAYAASAEVLTARQFVGAALILGGILLVELKPRADSQHQMV